MSALSTLNFECAERHSAELIELHNKIPFQYWQYKDLLSSGDGLRVYSRKWDVSCICIEYGRVIGFLVAFINYGMLPHGGEVVYLHRMAVHEDFRRRGIARSMVKFTCKSAIGVESCCDTVIAQTPNHSSCVAAKEFYNSIGMACVGSKAYPNKVDIIFSAKISDLKVLGV